MCNKKFLNKIPVFNKIAAFQTEEFYTSILNYSAHFD